MGQALGHRLAALGHSVLFSFSHNEQKLKDAAEAAQGEAKWGTPTEAANFADVVLLTVPWNALETALSSAGPLSGKVVLTTVSSNQPDFEGKATGLKTASDISAAERIAQLAPEAKVVEAFNITFSDIVASDSTLFEGERPTVTYCGDDADAKKTVAGLIEACGYEPMDVGDLKITRSQELLASAWVQMAAATKLFPNVALKILKR